jgi:hypothetical protein
VLLGQTVIPRRHAYGYGAITLSGQAFNPARLTRRFITRPGPVGDRTHRPSTPHAQPPTGITRARFGLVRFRSPLLTEYPFLQVLRCFTSLRTPRTIGAVTAHDGCRVTPFRNPRIKASSAAPRGISLPATSFIGPVCQGIHHTPLQATPHTGDPQDQTNTGRQIINTLRSQNDQTNNQTPIKGDPVEIHQYKQTTTSHPPKGRPRGPLASTLQFSNHHATPHTPTRNTREGTHGGHPNANPPTQGGPWRPGNPTACPYPPPQGRRNDPSTPARPAPREQNPRHHARQTKTLRRKEVIQPHLPVRLPCYDLVPITSLTLDGSPQQYWSGHRLRVLPTFMT